MTKSLINSSYSDNNMRRRETVFIGEKRTSVIMEQIFWNQLKLISTRENVLRDIIITDLYNIISDNCEGLSLTAGIRIYITLYMHILLQLYIHNQLEKLNAPIYDIVNNEFRNYLIKQLEG